MKNQISDIRNKVEMDISTVEERALLLLEKAYMKQVAGVEDGSLNPAKMAFLTT